MLKLGCDLVEPVNFVKEVIDKVGEFWDIENIALHDADSIVMKEFKYSIYFDERNYNVRLPWKCDTDILPDNFPLCKSRLNSLSRRLSNKPERLKEYDDIIKKQETEGIIESVSRLDIPSSGIRFIIYHIGMW